MTDLRDGACANFDQGAIGEKTKKQIDEYVDIN